MRLLVKVNIDVPVDYYTSGDGAEFVARVCAAIDEFGFEVHTHAGYEYGKMFFCTQGNTGLLWKAGTYLTYVLDEMVSLVHKEGFTASKIDARMWEGPGISCHDLIREERC